MVGCEDLDGLVVGALEGLTVITGLFEGFELDGAIDGFEVDGDLEGVFEGFLEGFDVEGE